MIDFYFVHYRSGTIQKTVIQSQTKDYVIEHGSRHKMKKICQDWGFFPSFNEASSALLQYGINKVEFAEKELSRLKKAIDKYRKEFGCSE